VALGVSDWHAAGWRGQGIKVAVLDSGFRGYRKLLGQVLPWRITGQSFRTDRNLEGKDSQHGILCGEVIHTLAPKAEVLMANWEPDQPEAFLRAMRWAREQGARIISCSVIMPGWSDGRGGGQWHPRLAEALGVGTANECLLFACAGNIAQRHWAGPAKANAQGYQLWSTGQMDNPLSPWDDRPVTIEVVTADPRTVTAQVWDTTRQRVVGNFSRARDHVAVRFHPDTDHHYVLRLKHERPSAGPIRVVALGAGLEQHTAEGSIAFPADGAAVIAVGAVDAQGHRAAYSAGGQVGPLPKPDFVASVPFPSRWREQPFGGTSAAAPQAAALAAVLWSKHPTWTAGQIRAALQKSSTDLNTPGHDWQTGYGLLHLGSE
jgi:subtilisin family serine protease